MIAAPPQVTAQAPPVGRARFVSGGTRRVPDGRSGMMQPRHCLAALRWTTPCGPSGRMHRRGTNAKRPELITNELTTQRRWQSMRNPLLRDDHITGSAEARRPIRAVRSRYRRFVGTPRTGLEMRLLWRSERLSTTLSCRMSTTRRVR